MIDSAAAGLYADAYGSEGSMNAGNITLVTGRLSLTGGARVTAPLYGLGNGGDIKIIAREAMTIVGEGYSSNRASGGLGFFSGVFTSSCDTCRGDAGQYYGHDSQPADRRQSGRGLERHRRNRGRCERDGHRRHRWQRVRR